MKVIKTRKKIALLIKYPKKILRYGINEVNENQYRKHTLTKYNREKLPTIDILDLFPELSETIQNYSYLPGNSLVTDVILLKSLAKNLPNCSYLEIGSWRGESLVNVADVAKECTSITLSEEEMKDLGFHENIIRQHGFFVKGYKNIDLIEHNSHTYDFSKLNKKFDLIFIDGDHSYYGVLNDTKSVFNYLKDDRSIIVWHDYASNTEDTRYSVLAAILDGIPQNEHSNIYHISNTMCAIYTKRKVSSKLKEYREKPNKKFTVSIKAEKI